MSEQYQQPPEDLEVLEDVNDALQLAFFNIDLEGCSVDDFPLTFENQDAFLNPRKYSKDGFDVSMGCGVRVTQFAYEEAKDDEDMITRVCVSIDWDDGNETNLVYFADQHVIATYLSGEDGSSKYKEFEGDEIRLPRIQLKLAFAAVTTFMDY